MERGPALRQRLEALGSAEAGGFDLAEAALTVAALDRRDGWPEEYRDHIAALAAELALAAGPGAEAETRARALAEVVARRHRYRGDDRDDDDITNANLMSVIDSRRGVAGALAIVYLEAARGAGWPAEMLAFPGAVLLRIGDEAGGRVIVDPFAGGLPLTAPDMRALLKATAGLDAELAPALFAPLSAREVLVRLQNEVKLRLLRCGRVDRAVRVVESTLLFAPHETPLWRECGLMHVRLGEIAPAVAALEQFATRTTNHAARNKTLALLAELRGRLQ